MVDDGVVVVILITLGLPTHQNINKTNLEIYKVWASLFWDFNAFGNMIWIRSTW